MQCERRMGQKLHSQGSLKAAFILTSHTLCLCFMQSEQKRVRFPSQGTGLPSSVCVVGCAFIIAVSIYQISKTKAEI